MIGTKNGRVGCGFFFLLTDRRIFGRGFRCLRALRQWPCRQRRLGIASGNYSQSIRIGRPTVCWLAHAVDRGCSNFTLARFRVKLSVNIVYRRKSEDHWYCSVQFSDASAEYIGHEIYLCSIVVARNRYDVPRTCWRPVEVFRS